MSSSLVAPVASTAALVVASNATTNVFVKSTPSRSLADCVAVSNETDMTFVASAVSMSSDCVSSSDSFSRLDALRALAAAAADDRAADAADAAADCC